MEILTDKYSPTSLCHTNTKINSVQIHPSEQKTPSICGQRATQGPCLYILIILHNKSLMRFSSYQNSRPQLAYVSMQ